MTFYLIRQWLYPLGFVASLCFATRFLIQWGYSELRKQCFIPIIFWKLSLIGSILMSLHGFLQSQFPITIIHGLNSLIAWRNLNLSTKKPKPLKKVFIIFGSTLLFLTLAFSLQYICSTSAISWMQSPKVFFLKETSETPILIWWHLWGVIGMIIFSTRFIIQWYYSEKLQKPSLPLLFWVISITGAVISLSYFTKIKDPVNIINYSAGLIPSIRNLILVTRSKIKK